MKWIRRIVLGCAVSAAAIPFTVIAAHAATVTGDGGNNTLRGTNSNDRIFGLGGDDRLHGRNGDDQVRGGAGSDLVQLGRGRDFAFGGGGIDTVDAGRDNLVDRVYGGAAGDEIFAFGPDLVWGGSGDDVIYATYTSPEMEIWCGGGNDHVIFNSPGPAVETHSCEHVRVISAG